MVNILGFDVCMFWLMYIFLLYFMFVVLVSFIFGVVLIFVNIRLVFIWVLFLRLIEEIWWLMVLNFLIFLLKRNFIFVFVSCWVMKLVVVGEVIWVIVCVVVFIIVIDFLRLIVVEVILSLMMLVLMMMMLW